MAKNWIVEKGHRGCSNYNCAGYGVVMPKSHSGVSPSGKVTTICNRCSRDSTYQARRWKERRACKGCGYFRNATVTLLGVSGNEQELARDYCDACELSASAANHEAQAKRMRAKAQMIVAKRKTSP